MTRNKLGQGLPFFERSFPMLMDYPKHQVQHDKIP